MAGGSKKRKKSKDVAQQQQQQGLHVLAEGHSDVQGQAMEDGRALIFVRWIRGQQWSRELPFSFKYAFSPNDHSKLPAEMKPFHSF